MHTRFMLALAAIALPGCVLKGQAGAGGSTGGYSGGGGGYSDGAGGGGGGGGGGDGGDGLDIPGEWSLAERQYWHKLIEEQDEYLKQLNSDCGSQITASFVWESFRGHWNPNEDSYGVDAYVRAHAVTPLTAVRNVCVKGDMQRGAVRAGISEILIEYGPGNAEPRMGLQGGLFHVVIEPAHTAAGSWEYPVMQFVESKI